MAYDPWQVIEKVDSIQTNVNEYITSLSREGPPASNLLSIAQGVAEGLRRKFSQLPDELPPEYAPVEVVKRIIPNLRQYLNTATQSNGNQAILTAHLETLTTIWGLYEGTGRELDDIIEEHKLTN